jgi:hypothetical protein
MNFFTNLDFPFYFFYMVSLFKKRGFSIKLFNLYFKFNFFLRSFNVLDFYFFFLEVVKSSFSLFHPGLLERERLPFPLVSSKTFYSTYKKSLRFFFSFRNIKNLVTRDLFKEILFFNLNLKSSFINYKEKFYDDLFTLYHKRKRKVFFK